MRLRDVFLQLLPGAMRVLVVDGMFRHYTAIPFQWPVRVYQWTEVSEECAN